MTSELKSEPPRAEPSVPDAAKANSDGDRVAVLHLRVSLVFLALGSISLALAGGRLVYPDLLSDVGLLAYGRLMPAALGLLIYGWLTIGLIGAGYYILPRMSGNPLAHAGWALFGGGLVAVGVLQGSVAVALGAGEGRQYLEFPIWSDAVIVLGLLLVVRTVTATIASDRDHPLAPVEWFYGSAPVWLLLATIAGNVPGLTGVNSALQTSFYRGALLGLWLATAAIGIVYYLAARITGRDPRKVTQLTVITFWSAAALFALSAGSRLTYTAAPDWLETLSGVFAIALLLPVAAVVADLAAALRGSKPARRRATVRFLIAGAVAFAVLPVVNLALAMRGSNSVVGLTDWVFGLDVIAIFGAFGFWLLAFVHHTLVGDGRGIGHFRVSTLAVAVLAGSLLVGGVKSGLSWVAAANSGEVAAGEGFRQALISEGELWVRFVALGLFALAQLGLLTIAWRARSAAADELEAHLPAENDADADAEEGEESGPAGLPLAEPVSLARVRVGTLAVFVVVGLFAFGFPVLEAEHTTETALASAVRNYDADDFIERGRTVYLAEGCWYCHTQEVRGIVTDVGLGPVAVAGDYANEAPTTAGVMRAGPDLMFAGSRDLTRDWLNGYLADPRGVREWSTMPAHDYLSATDLDAVATYISSLQVFEFE